MTATRGFVYAVYFSDNGTAYAKQVQRNYADDPVRGWTAFDPLTPVPLFPMRAKPRMVYGVSPTTGRRNYTIAASVTAPIWLGSANQGVDVFQSETDDGSSDDYVVTRRRGESFASPH